MEESGTLRKAKYSAIKETVAPKIIEKEMRFIAISVCAKLTNGF
jgi:hypothetical protein